MKKGVELLDGQIAIKKILYQNVKSYNFFLKSLKMKGLRMHVEIKKSQDLIIEINGTYLKN